MSLKDISGHEVKRIYSQETIHPTEKQGQSRKELEDAKYFTNFKSRRIFQSFLKLREALLLGGILVCLNIFSSKSTNHPKAKNYSIKCDLECLQPWTEEQVFGLLMCVKWYSGGTMKDWQTDVIIPIHKNGDRRE